MKLSETMKTRLVGMLAPDAPRFAAQKNERTYAALNRRGLIEYGELRFGRTYRVLLTDEGRKVAEELRGEDDQAKEAPKVAPSPRRVPSDWWTITDRADAEIVRVYGETMQDATAAAREHAEVRDASRRDGGFQLRRLYEDELTEAEAAPADPPAFEDYMFPADVERVAKTYPIGVRATGRNPRGEQVAGVVTGYAQFGSARDGYTTVAEIDQEETTGGYAMLCEAAPLPKCTSEQDLQDLALEHAQRHGVHLGMHTTVHLNGRTVTGCIRKFYMTGDLGKGEEFRLPMAHVRDEKTGRNAYVIITELTPAADPHTTPATLTPGTRVTTPHGPATITQPPTQMASGWTVKVVHDTPHTASGEGRYRVDELTPATPLPKRTPGATLPAKPTLPKRTPGTHTGVQDAIDRHRTTPAIRQALATLRPDQKRAITRTVTTPTTRESGRLLATPYVYVPLIGAGLVRTKRGKRYLTPLGRQVAEFLADRR